MEIKATLNKPYTDKQRADFIVENNHNKGYEIQETEDVLLAVYNEPTAKELAEARIAELKEQLVASDYVALKMSEAIALNDAELLGLLKMKYKDKLEERQSIRNQIDELEEMING